MKNKINVLGQEYKIEYHRNKEDVKLENCFGYHEQFSKKIVIDQDLIDESTGKIHNPKTSENLEVYVNKVYRHEIIHAFFEESGLTYHFDRIEDEDFVVDWIARQFPKMKKIFEELGVDQ